MSNRIVILDGETYEYRIGRSHVVIRHNDKKIGAPNFSELTGEKWHVIEHDSHKRNFHLTPKHIVDWIIDNYAY